MIDAPRLFGDLTAEPSRGPDGRPQGLPLLRQLEADLRAQLDARGRPRAAAGGVRRRPPRGAHGGYLRGLGEDPVTQAAVAWVLGTVFVRFFEDNGLVWSAILDQIDRVDSESAFVSVRDLEQPSLHSHPGSIGGGGAAELKELLDERREKTLGEVVEAIGRTMVVGDDDVWMADAIPAKHYRVDAWAIPFAMGEDVRDWRLDSSVCAIYPYSPSPSPSPSSPPTTTSCWSAAPSAPQTSRPSSPGQAGTTRSRRRRWG